MKKLNHYTTLPILATILFFQGGQLVAQNTAPNNKEAEGQFNQLEPKKLEQVNSDAEESMPVITADDQQLYFMRTQVASKKKLSKSGQEIWVANREGETWGSPQKEQLNINDLANNAVIGSSADGNTLYLFNSVETRHKLAKGLAYLSKDSTGKWGEIKKLSIPGFEAGDGYYAFYVTPDERTLLVSAAIDTMVYEDLYVSEKIDENWTALKSLGPNINTLSIETSPFISEDKQTLYFSSAGHGGYGETDLFMSTRTGEGWDQWSTPVNLGEKINSARFDAYLVVSSDKNTAYFSSDRDGNYSEIYYVEDFGKTKFIKKNLVRLAFDETILANEPVEVYNSDGELMKVIYTDENGVFPFEKLAGIYYRIKEVNVSEDDMLAYAENQAKEDSSEEVVYNLFSKKEQSPIQFVFDGEVMDNAVVELLSAEGEVIGTVTTDEKGRIDASAIGTAHTYRIGSNTVTDEVLAEKVTSSKSSSNGVAVVDFNSTKSPIQFVFDGEVMDNAVVELLSAEGEVIGTVTTDEKGRIDASAIGTAHTYRIGSNTVKDEVLAEKVTSSKSSSNGVAVVDFNSVKEITNSEIEQEFIIYFDFDQWIIKPEEKIKLDELIALSKNRGQLQVKLIGHTDYKGPQTYNLTLSNKRVQAVNDYLASNGQKLSVINTEAIGELKPAADNSTIIGRAMNRRVEVKIQK